MKKKRDLSYHPHVKQKGRGKKQVKSESSIFAMRANTKEFLTPQTKYKSSFMLKQNAIESTNSAINLKGLEKNIQKKLESHATFRPVADIVEYTKNQSPKIIYTPNKTPLENVGDYGLLYFFSNDPAAIPYEKIKIQKYIDPSSEFFKSASYTSVQEMFEDIKQQTVLITAELLKKTKKENAKHPGRRISQNKAMTKPGALEKEASATKYANATCLFETNLSWEWLHTIMHAVLGDQTQDPDYLVGGTKSANTDMEMVEETLAYLSKKYPEGFTLQTYSSMLGNPKKKTQIATIIEYNIKTPDFILPFRFNAQNPNQPHLSFKDYIQYIVEAFAELNQSKQDKKQKKRTARQLFSDEKQNEAPLSLFFTKKQKVNSESAEKIQVKKNRMANNS